MKKTIFKQAFTLGYDSHELINVPVATVISSDAKAALMEYKVTNGYDKGTVYHLQSHNRYFFAGHEDEIFVIAE